ncbi:hypothetical protein AB0E56_13140 [Microbacterium sp. NPDC028030]|uniref:hypothetical protein n=1 Tax=Microbacterium sp. NPDC028030 TaxID=3155124 RepID=UPI0033EF1465
MSDQRLVEALEKALTDEVYDGGMGYLGDEQFPAYVRRLAETAAGVLAGAHTPTDDERREALHLIEQAASFREQTNADPEPSPNSMVGLWLRTASALEAALRRTEVPEPSADHHAIRVCIDIASTVYGGYDDAQGALSDIHMMLAPIVERHEPQGEPSDAQVIAALNAYWEYDPPVTDVGYWSEKHVGIMRAALRAAGGVR